jgi:diguanylate cyclase (GGDEF)-like protein
MSTDTDTTAPAAPDYPVPANEAERLAELHQLHILDTERDADFDLLAAAAAEICHVPYAFVSLVDADRVWMKAAHGTQPLDTTRGEACCTLAILQDGVLEIPDLTQDPRTAQLPLTVSGHQYRMYAGAVLATEQGHHLGTLCVLDTAPHPLTAHQRQLLSGLAGQVMRLLELRSKHRELQQATAELQRMATTDPLTGLSNRRALNLRLQACLQSWQRYKYVFSVVLVDLDHFKAVNDRHGHAAGDEVLVHTARVIQTRIRVGDTAARLGGEEFCVLLPNTPLAGARHWAEQCRLQLQALQVAHEGKVLQVTASLGVCEVGALERPGLENMLKAADDALYAAKASGRNRVVAHAAKAPA